MIELHWAWRVWFGQIALGDVPEMIRAVVAGIVEELRKNEH